MRRSICTGFRRARMRTRLGSYLNNDPGARRASPSRARPSCCGPGRRPVGVARRRRAGPRGVGATGGPGGARGPGRRRHPGAGARARGAASGPLRGRDPSRPQQRRPAGDNRAGAPRRRRPRGVRNLFWIGRGRDLGERQPVWADGGADAAARGRGARAARGGAGRQSGRSAQGDVGGGLDPGAADTCRAREPSAAESGVTRIPPVAGADPASPGRGAGAADGAALRAGRRASGGRSPLRQFAGGSGGASSLRGRGLRRRGVARDPGRGHRVGAHADARVVPRLVRRAPGGERLRDDHPLRRRQHRRLGARQQRRRDCGVRRPASFGWRLQRERGRRCRCLPALRRGDRKAGLHGQHGGRVLGGRGRWRRCGGRGGTGLHRARRPPAGHRRLEDRRRRPARGRPRGPAALLARRLAGGALVRAVVLLSMLVVAAAGCSEVVTVVAPEPTAWPVTGHSANSDPWLVDHNQVITSMTPAVLVLNFDPAKSSGDTLQYANDVAQALAVGSMYHGYSEPTTVPFLNYQVKSVVDLTMVRPPVIATPPPTIDLTALFNDASFPPLFGYSDGAGGFLSLCQLFEQGVINEVWIQDGGDAQTTPRAPLYAERKQVYDANWQAIPGDFLSNLGLNTSNLAVSCGVTVRVAHLDPSSTG